MDFGWTDEQRALSQQVTTFAQEHLSPGAASRDRDATFSRTLWRECGGVGLLGLNVAREYGGQGLDILSTTCALEALGYGCRDRGLALAVSAHLTTTLPTDLGWDRVVTPPVSVCQMPTEDHLRMLTEPHVARLAASVNHVLREPPAAAAQPAAETTVVTSY